MGPEILYGVAAAGAAPATTGLFGAAGAFTWGATLSTVGTALSGVMSAASALSSGQSQSSAAQYNAAVARNNAIVAQQNAQIAADQAAADARRQRDQAIKEKGKMRAAYGASGVTVEGSPLDVLEESALNAELDALITEYNGGLRARAYQNQAVAELNTATLEDMRGEAALSGSYTSAAGSLFGGAAKVGSRLTPGPGSTPTQSTANIQWYNTPATEPLGWLDSQ